MQARFARHTHRLDEAVRFYGEGLGLPELGRFDDHDGYSGVFFGLPGTAAQLEFTSGGRTSRLTSCSSDAVRPRRRV
ncbi:MAG TPA: hypothetical protein VF232_06905 [Gaiellaceae bacterium]